MRSLAAVACLVAVCVADADEAPLRLTPGDELSRTLQGSESHDYEIAADDYVLVVIENLGRGTILTVSNDAGDVLVRTANWRQSEGRHGVVLEPGAPVRLSVTADEPVAPPGDYRIRVSTIPPDGPEFDAEREMMLGADARLRHYYGEADGRGEALDYFLEAVAGFTRAADQRRRADALFEAAGVYYSLGEHDEATATYGLAAELWQGLGDSRGLATAEVQLGLIEWQTNRLDLAIVHFRRAAARRHALGDRFFEAQALNDTGLVYRDLNDARSAIDYFERALAIWQGSTDLMSVDPSSVDFDSVPDPPWLSDALVAMDNLAWASELRADTAATERILLQALALSRYLDRRQIEAQILNNLGRLKYKTGELQAALDYLDRAIAYFESASRNEIWAGNAHQTRSQVFQATGDLVRAEIELRAALAFRTEERDPVRRAETLLALAELGLQAHEESKTLENIEAALSLLKAHGDNPVLRGTANELAAQAYRFKGETELALQHHGQAIGLFAASDDVRGEAGARMERALTLSRQGDVTSALSDLEWSLSQARLIEDKLLQFRTLTSKATVYAQAKRWDSAIDSAREALELSESVREELADPMLLRFFSAVQRDAYETLVNAELAQDDITGAWRASNESRARRLAELMTAGHAAPAKLNDAKRKQYDSLVQMRAARAEELTQSLARNADDNEIEGMRSELADIVQKIERYQLPAARDERAQVAGPELAAVQAALGPADVLLEYFVGDSVGAVWRITQDDFDVHSVPGAGELTNRVGEITAAIRQRRELPRQNLVTLSRRLIPKTDDAGGRTRHVIFIPDGPLFYLPFSMLPDPASQDGAPLIASKDVSYLPSVAMLTQSGARGDFVAHRLAILADPVFNANDPRLHGGGALRAGVASGTTLEGELTRSTERNNVQLLSRLPGTREEAQTVRSAAIGADVFMALDTDANRELVMSGVLDDYDVIHFATHAILDADEPALSGIVLSGVTATGAPMPRFLRSQDVAALRLNADLVVLSGCETGLGRVVDSEGVVGLSQAFFRAGARQVVSSLWRIPDRATATLMEHFYRGIYQDGLEPKSALREAQLAMRQSRWWRDPYYWAGFVVQGH